MSIFSKLVYYFYILFFSNEKNLQLKLFEPRVLQGWSYVGDRLLSAVIPYEESGWYDGQMWVKPPEVSILSI